RPCLHARKRRPRQASATKLGFEPRVRRKSHRWSAPGVGVGSYGAPTTVRRPAARRHLLIVGPLKPSAVARCRQLRVAEPGHVMPDPLERLLVVSPGAGRVA